MTGTTSRGSGSGGRPAGPAGGPAQGGGTPPPGGPPGGPAGGAPGAGILQQPGAQAGAVYPPQGALKGHAPEIFDGNRANVQKFI